MRSLALANISNTSYPLSCRPVFRERRRAREIESPVLRRSLQLRNCQMVTIGKPSGDPHPIPMGTAGKQCRTLLARDGQASRDSAMNVKLEDRLNLHELEVLKEAFEVEPHWPAIWAVPLQLQMFVDLWRRGWVSDESGVRAFSVYHVGSLWKRRWQAGEGIVSCSCLVTD